MTEELSARELQDILDQIEQVSGIYHRMVSRPNDFTTKEHDDAVDHLEKYMATLVAKLPIPSQEDTAAGEAEEETETETNDEQQEPE